MSWVADVRGDVLYMVQKRPLDPRWSQQDLHVLLGWCASAQALGWTEERAFITAEAIVMKKKHHDLSWAQENLVKDMELLLVSGEKHEAEQENKENSCVEE
jgi:hypothetical protein